MDVLFLIHHAMRRQAEIVEVLARELHPGDSLQRFRMSFYSWASYAAYHSEKVERYITTPLIRKELAPEVTARDPQTWKTLVELASLEEELHGDLLMKAEGILRTLDKEIGKTSLIPRTKQHLYSRMVSLRLTQEDHLETEEVLVLPMLRMVMDEERQMEVARHLLLDHQAEDPNWSLDWVLGHLSAGQQGLVNELVARFKGERPKADQTGHAWC